MAVDRGGALSRHFQRHRRSVSASLGILYGPYIFIGLVYMYIHISVLYPSVKRSGVDFLLLSTHTTVYNGAS